MKAPLYGKEDCSFDGCERPVEKSGLCSGHRKQRVRGQPLRDLATRSYSGNATARAAHRVERAALRLADADDDDEYRRAKVNLLDAARWFGIGLSKSNEEADRLFGELRAVLRKVRKGERVGNLLSFPPRASPRRPSLLAG